LENGKSPLLFDISSDFAYVLNLLKTQLKKSQLFFSRRFRRYTMRIFVNLILFSLIPLAFSNENSSSYLIARPLIFETQLKNINDNVNLHCTSWRFAAETNNLAPWKTIPVECADYVKDYLMGEGYVVDVERVSEEAKVYASSFESNGDGKDIWIFDIVESSLLHGTRLWVIYLKSFILQHCYKKLVP